MHGLETAVKGGLQQFEREKKWREVLQGGRLLLIPDRGINQESQNIEEKKDNKYLVVNVVCN